MISTTTQRGTRDLPTRRIGNVDVTVAPQLEAIDLIRSAVEARRSTVFAFCNAHTLNLARDDAAFATVLRRSTVFNDGIGLEIASRLIYGCGFPTNLNGTDLTTATLKTLRRPTRVFLVGSASGVAERAGIVIEQTCPMVRISGTQQGFFPPEEASGLAERIRKTGADLVLAGMGNPRQEKWAAAWADTIGAPICCIGAWLDFTAGDVVRAPRWIQAARMEWAFRLAQEPRRLARRYVLGNPRFLLAMSGEAVKWRWTMRKGERG